MKRPFLFAIAALLASCGPAASTGGSSTPPSESSSSLESSKHPFELTQEMLSKISGSLLLEGEAQFHYDMEFPVRDDYTSTLKVSFNPESFYSLEQVSTGQSYQSNIVKRGELPYTYYVNAQNEVEYVRVEDAGKQYEWEDFANPFASLPLSAFRQTSDPSTYMVGNLQLIQEAGRTITGYEFDFKGLRVEVEETAISKVLLFGEGVDSYGDPLDFQIDLQVVSTTYVNQAPKPYERQKEHDLLDEAFLNTLTTSFTITHLDHHDEYGDTVYHYYFADDAIYCDIPESGDTLPFGYVELEDGVYSFTNGKEGLLKGNKTTAATVQEFYPNFQGFDSTILKSESETRFVSYDNDNASIVAKYVCENPFELTTAGAAQTLAIELASSRIYSISYFYSILGGFTEGNVTMTFSDFGSTEVDLDFSSLS